MAVGIGTGKNLPYYKSEIELTAIDFSSGMLGIAQHKYGKTKLKKLTFKEIDAQNLSFDDNTFDTIISTFVFCIVPDPISGIKEIRRVLKPSGKAIFLEHMKSNSKFINIPFIFPGPLYTNNFRHIHALQNTGEYRICRIYYRISE